MSTISASTTSTTAYKVTADTTGTLVLQTGATPTTAVTIDGSQNVGIGTSSPSNKLSVVSPDNNAYTNVVSAYSNNLAQSTSLTFGGLRTVTGAGLGFYVNGSTTTAASIDSSGNLLVGTTSAIGAGLVGIKFDGSAKNGIQLQTTYATIGSGFLYFVNSAGTTIGNVNQNASNTVAYNTSSDYRLKENIQPMLGALEKVLTLKPVTYTWKEDGSDGQGFIAHELQSVVPDCVTGEKDAVDAEGNPVYQGIDTSFLVATLTAAIQELKAELDAAKADIATLKGAA